MRLAQLVSRMCAELGLPQAQPNGAGAFGFRIDGLELTLSSLEANNAFVACAHVGRVAMDDEPMLARLMTGNLFASREADVVIGADFKGMVFVMQRFDEPFPSHERFRRRLSSMIDVALHWRQVLAAPPAHGPHAS